MMLCSVLLKDIEDCNLYILLALEQALHGSLMPYITRSPLLTILQEPEQPSVRMSDVL